MLNLITGQPGNGKTLFTLGLVEKLRQETGRPVYQSGIPELTLPWESLNDPLLWPSLPNGSIVVIDECQRVFPPRKQGAAVPPHVAEFETHRHRGFDIFLITQHPQLLDIAVRKLTGRHYHLKRTFGQEVATVYQWEEATDPNERGKRAQALTTRFAFPKERFGWYKSAEVHTVQKRLPWKPIATLAGAIIAIGFLSWFAWSKMPHGETVADAVSQGGEVLAPSLSSVPDLWTPGALQARLPTWLWSAPFYDSVQKVQSAPRVTGCAFVKMGNTQTCHCSTGQGRADVSDQFCRDYMAGRYFDPSRPEVDAKALNIAYLEATRGVAVGSQDQEVIGSEPAT